jgi:hypothetical protein
VSKRDVFVFPSVNNTTIALHSTCNYNNSNIAVIATANTNWNDLYPITLLAMMYLLLLSVQAIKKCTRNILITSDVGDQFRSQELRNS